MSDHAIPKCKRKGNGHKRKVWDFIPNKDQLIYGAFMDLGKPKPIRYEAAAKRIAAMWGELI